MSSSALPNLLIVGAMKCGTTSLHDYLAAHPEISMSEPKELNFFPAQARWNRGVDWYESHFDGECPIRGESSPSYTFFPFAQGVPERAAGLIPGAKIVYLVRDPVDRIVSQYQHWVAAGREQSSFDAVVDSIAEEFSGREAEHLIDQPGYLARSMYFEQIDRWRQFYADSEIRVMDQAELRGRRSESMQSLVDFLGLQSPFPDALAGSGELNRSEGKRRASRFGATVRRYGGIRAARALPEGVRRPLVNTFIGAFDDVPQRPEPTPEQRRYLTGLLAEDIASFRAFSGLAFESWDRGDV